MWTITNTPLLWGMLAVAAVAMLHLWRRRRPVRRILFTGGSLLRMKETKPRSEARLRDRALMLLRMTAVGLIVLAFVGMAWRSDSAGARAEVIRSDGTNVVESALASNSAAVCVVVLDASASMGRVVDGVDWFAAAKETARRTVEQSNAMETRVVIAGGRWPGAKTNSDVWELGRDGPRGTEGPAAGSHADLSAAIDRVTAGRSGAHPASAMALARRLIGIQHGRVAVVSDFQATDWRDEVERAAASHRASVRIAWLPVSGSRDGANVGVGGLSILSGRPVAGTRGDFIVTVENHSERLRGVELLLSMDGREVTRRMVPTEAWGHGEALFSVEWGAAGTRRVTCKIIGGAGEDVLDADDVGEWKVDVVDRPRVLLVSDDSREAGGGDYYWRRAIEAGERFQLSEKWSREVNSEAMASADVVVIGRVESFSPVTARLLALHVRRGGGVVWCTGYEGAAATWQSFQQAVRRETQVEAAPAWRWRGAVAKPIADAATVRPTDGSSVNPWAGIAFNRRWEFDRDPGPTEKAVVPFEFGDHQPLAWAWRPWRAGGNAVVVNIGTDLAWSDAASGGVFAATAHAVVNAAAMSDGAIHGGDNVPAKEGDLRSMAIRTGESEASEREESRNAEVSARAGADSDKHVLWPWAILLAVAILIIESAMSAPTGGQRV